jgi:hypothetical protein
MLYEKTISGSDVTVQKYSTTGSAQIAVRTIRNGVFQQVLL